MPDTRSLVVERDMAHPPQRIWRALTQGPLIEEWLLQNDFQPIVGHKFRFQAPARPNWSGVIESEVLVVEPPTRLAYRWSPVGDQPGTGPQWVVTWTLTPIPTGTRLRMEQSGFTSEQEANYKGATYGWQKFLGNLEQVVAKLP